MKQIINSRKIFKEGLAVHTITRKLPAVLYQLTTTQMSENSDFSHGMMK